jgi:hypothetical protein
VAPGSPELGREGEGATANSMAGKCNTPSCIPRIIERYPQFYVPHLHLKKRAYTKFRD